jgi:hypothetical protein
LIDYPRSIPRLQRLQGAATTFSFAIHTYATLAAQPKAKA